MATLKKVLGQMLSEARKHTGSPISRTLANGMRVEVTQAANGMVQLSLERPNTPPTEADWQLVLSRWPERVPDDMVPAPHKLGRRFSLTGRWARPAVITETTA